MRTELSEEEQITGFELYNIRDFSLQSTLDSQIPEGIILSILTDYKKSDTGKVIEEIIYKLQQASKSESELNKSLKQLLVLSRLRKLEGKIKQKVSNMPITYDISKGPTGSLGGSLREKRIVVVHPSIVSIDHRLWTIDYHPFSNSEQTG